MPDKIKKSITLDDDVIEFIEELGKQENRTFSNMLNQVLREAMNKQKKTK
jgi:uncharacterized protein (DUF4415 family)